jgi:hypothetical protein
MANFTFLGVIALAFLPLAIVIFMFRNEKGTAGATK